MSIVSIPFRVHVIIVPDLQRASRERRRVRPLRRRGAARSVLVSLVSSSRIIINNNLRFPLFSRMLFLPLRNHLPAIRRIIRPRFRLVFFHSHRRRRLNRPSRASSSHSHSLHRLLLVRFSSFALLPYQTQRFTRGKNRTIRLNAFLLMCVVVVVAAAVFGHHQRKA